MTKSLDSSAARRNIELVIIGSRTLGPSSLTAQGFEWAWTVDIESLAPIIGKMQVMEARWGDLIRQWQVEGAMGDDEIDITPGAIAWLVAIDAMKSTAPDINELEMILGQVAEKVASLAPQAAIGFGTDSASSKSLASEMVNALRTAVPIPYRVLKGNSFGREWKKNQENAVTTDVA